MDINDLIPLGIVGIGFLFPGDQFICLFAVLELIGLNCITGIRGGLHFSVRVTAVGRYHFFLGGGIAGTQHLILHLHIIVLGICADQCDSNYTAIGYSNSGGGYNFSGHFDGCGHTISGIRINRQQTWQGLFGYVTNHNTVTTPEVKNITLDNASISGSDYTAGIVGELFFGNVENCHVTSTVTLNGLDDGSTSQSHEYGGIVGENWGTITHCTSAATITADAGVSTYDYGGIVGSSSGTISHCTSTATINVTNGKRSSGGVVGAIADGTMSHCLAVGVTVSGEWAAAIVGANSSDNEDDANLDHNYYADCNVTISGELHTTNVGCGSRRGQKNWLYNDVTDNDGAVPVASATDLTTAELYDRGTVNPAAIDALNGQTLDVTLYGRTLYKDGDWNTLCLPFDVTVGSGPLSGADARTLNAATSNFNAATGLLTLNFDAATGTIPAGTPFIVKWADGTDLVSPVFSGVQIDNSPEAQARQTVSAHCVQFCGTYDPAALEANTTANLYLGGANKLYYPTTDGYRINPFRAYFLVDLTSSAGVRAFNIDFGDDATGIASTDSQDASDGADVWYSLDGRRLDGKPTQRGVYVNNGRKIVIK